MSRSPSGIVESCPPRDGGGCCAKLRPARDLRRLAPPCSAVVASTQACLLPAVPLLVSSAPLLRPLRAGHLLAAHLPAAVLLPPLRAGHLLAVTLPTAFVCFVLRLLLTSESCHSRKGQTGGASRRTQVEAQENTVHARATRGAKGSGMPGPLSLRHIGDPDASIV